MKGKITGRKRHISIDVLGLLICIYIHSVGIFDLKEAKLVIAITLSISPHDTVILC